MQLKIHANGHNTYLQTLQLKLKQLFYKINKDPDLLPAEKFKARQKAIKSVKKAQKESLKNCYWSLP